MTGRWWRVIAYGGVVAACSPVALYQLDWHSPWRPTGPAGVATPLPPPTVPDPLPPASVEVPNPPPALAMPRATPVPLTPAKPVDPSRLLRAETPPPPPPPPIVPSRLLNRVPAVAEAEIDPVLVPAAKPIPAPAVTAVVTPAVVPVVKPSPAALVPPPAADHPAQPEEGGQPGPVYPAAAWKAGREGVVSLLVWVDTRGKVLNVELNRSSGAPDLDAAALRQVREHWRYQPAIRNGTPAADTVEVVVRFQLGHR